MPNRTMTRRALLGGASLLPLLSPRSAEAWLFSRGGVSIGGSAPSGGTLGTLTLVNTSASAQTANFISPMFGWAFKEGDVPAAATAAGTISGAGTTTLTVSGAAGTIAAGQLIAGGAGAIPANTVVAAVAGSAVTMSQASTGALSGSALIFSGAPHFQVGGVDQPYSWGMQNYWSDGSLRYAGFMLRCGTGVAGSGTLAVSVLSGGSCPAPSARTLAEVYAQNLVVTGAGLGAGPNYGLGGTWQSWLNGDANQPEAYACMDGAAGKVWRALSHFAETKGGAPHGQLECYHYIAGLSDANGNLGGFRYLGRICQPWYNLDPTNGQPADWAASTVYSSGAYVQPLSGNANWMIFKATTGGTSGTGEPAWPQTVGATQSDGGVTWTAITPAKNWRGFSAINYQTVGPGGSGTATVGLTWPFTSAAFTWSSANTYTTTAANNFFCGASSYSGTGNLIPCYLTTTGALPTGLNTGQIYWVLALETGGDAFTLFTDSATGGAAN
ncbi:MAG: hypothetical protein ACREFK_13890, partial [Stellaceae bacterium]